MQNRCLVIMAPGEPSGYPQGHINRVYDYIIVPACRLAGYWPARIDQVTQTGPLDGVREIVDSEIVVCDVSAGNSDALYGLAVRQGLGLPVMLVKDMKSLVTFMEPEIIEYDESLRIDTVQKTIEVLSEALKNSAENKSHRSDLLNRLNIGLKQNEPAETSTTPVDDEPSHQEEEAETRKVRLPIISPLPDYVGDPFSEQEIGHLKAGDVFFHLNHGKGKVNFVKKDRLASIQFESGAKFLVLAASDFFRKIKP